MMSLSPSLFDYIVKYIYIYAHRREQWMEQCREKKAPRSNRALFDLRDKDKKNRYRERGRGYYAYTFWTGYTPHTHAVWSICQ